VCGFVGYLAIYRPLSGTGTVLSNVLNGRLDLYNRVFGPAEHTFTTHRVRCRAENTAWALNRSRLSMKFPIGSSALLLKDLSDGLISVTLNYLYPRK
jgi:hypothetical protein